MKAALLVAFLILSGYVNSPAHVPNFDNFHTPVIKPGEIGKFNFTIENRYVNPMRGVVLDVGIYMWATEDSHMEIEKVENHPLIMESNEVNYTMHLGDIYPGINRTVDFHIITNGGAPNGVYFVRFHISFTYNSSHYEMWSPGYFSKSVWDNATKNHTLNLEYLSQAIGKPVDGIVPDSSFSVKSDLTWILYILIGITAIVGFLAFYTYMKEEQISNPVDEKYYELKGKYRELERKLKKKRQNP